MQAIEIKTSQGICTEIYVDGHSLEGVRSFELKQIAGQAPVLTLDLYAFNVSVDQNVILWNKNKDSGMRISFGESGDVVEPANIDRPE